MFINIYKITFPVFKMKTTLSNHKYLLKYHLAEYCSTFLLPEFIDVPTGWLKEIDPYLMYSSFQLLNQEMKVVTVPRWKKWDGGAECNSSVRSLSIFVQVHSQSISTESNKNLEDHIKELQNNQDFMHHFFDSVSVPWFLDCMPVWWGQLFQT